MRALSTRILQEPILYFILIGALLYSLFADLSEGTTGQEDRAILVNRSTLLEFVQYRMKMFEPTAAAAYLDGLDEKGRKELSASYIEEEALFRQALQLGLDNNDYVIKRRIVQKMEFILDATAGPALKIEPGELDGFFLLHQSDYSVPAQVSFSHVFVMDQDKLETLSSELVGKTDRSASEHRGDRFPWGNNFSEVTAVMLTPRFGEEMVERIFSARTALEQWQGPLRSSQGWHYLYITARSESHLPDLAEIRPVVEFDYRDYLKEKLHSEAVDQLITSFTVRHESLTDE